MKSLTTFFAASLLATHAWAQDSALVVAFDTEPPGLDPTTNVSTATSASTWMNIYEGLTAYEDDGSISPSLAASWDIEGAKVYTFKLQEGVTFHDGSTFDAEDVKFSLDRARAEDSTNPKKPNFNKIETVEVIDPLTVKVTLKTPSNLFLYYLAEPSAAMIASETAETNAGTPVGTGPFKFVSWNRGDRIEFERYDAYWTETPVTMDTVSIRYFGNSNSMGAALRAGDIDYMPAVNTLEMVKDFGSDDRFEVRVGQTQGVLSIVLNNEVEALGDKRVREAIYHALDWRGINEVAHSGLGTPRGTHMTPVNPYYVDTAVEDRYDLEQAQALLQEAGYGDGFDMTFKVLPQPTLVRTAELAAAMLSAINIRVRIETLELAQWLDVVFKNESYDATVLTQQESWAFLTYADPTRFYNYDSATFQALVKEGEEAPNEDVAFEKMAEAQKFLADDMPSIWLYGVPNVSIADAKLTGIRTNLPVPAYPFAEISRTE
ncbi:MAG: ABC transporter substrate-binding protein [Pseudomonadota bacterium]|nr:ABC transporter substrate-binding protein [Pseudomonadota bacterium]